MVGRGADEGRRAGWGRTYASAFAWSTVRFFSRSILFPAGVARRLCKPRADVRLQRRAAIPGGEGGRGAVWRGTPAGRNQDPPTMARVISLPSIFLSSLTQFFTCSVTGST